jgi:hypothetical protein
MRKIFVLTILHVILLFVASSHCQGSGTGVLPGWSGFVAPGSSPAFTNSLELRDLLSDPVGTGRVLFDTDPEVQNTLTVNGILKSHSPVHIVDGFNFLTGIGGSELFHMFVAGVMTEDTPLPSAFANSLVQETTTGGNANGIEFVFWDDVLHRPVVTLNDAGLGLASFFERSVVVGDGKGAKALDNSYLDFSSTYTHLAFNTAEHGACLGVEHALEVLGMIYTPTLIADVLESENELYINPNSPGNVRLFDGTDIADATDGKRLYIYRRALEGDSYMDFHIQRDQEAHFNSNVDIVFTDGITEFLRMDTVSHKINAPWGLQSLGNDVLTSYTETDPVYTAWNKSTGISITESQISDLSHNSTWGADLHGFTEYEIPYGNSMGDGLASISTFKYDGSKMIIGSANSNQWNSAYGWGDHALAGYQTSAFNGDGEFIYNSAGDLQVQADGQGDVVIYRDVVIGDAINGKMLYVRREAVEGNEYIRLYVSSNQAGIVSASSDLTMHAVDSVMLQSDTKDVILRMGDDAGAKGTYFKNSSNDIVGYVDSLGNAQFNTSVDVPEVFNSLGDLKVMPDAQGDVILFGDTDVSNAVEGNEFRVWRRAAEGNDYIRFYITANQAGMIHTSSDLTLQGQATFTINSVTDDIVFKVGDNAGAKKVYFKDSDGVIVAEIDSNGNADFDGNISLLGTVDGIDLSDEIPLKADLASPALTGNVTVDGNYVLEGDSDGKNILRKIQLQVRDGLTPGTNLDIFKFTTQGRAYNAPTITDADDLAKSGTSGSYSLSANGENLTLDLTETVHTVLSCTVVSDDLNNGAGGGYYVHTLVISGNIQIMVEKSGSETNLDWTAVTNTSSDFAIFDIAFLTMD